MSCLTGVLTCEVTTVSEQPGRMKASWGEMTNQGDHNQDDSDKNEPDDADPIEALEKVCSAD